jgi:hypothetical protein
MIPTPQNMDDLISNLVEIYQASTGVTGISQVYKGFNSVPDQIPQTSYPYIVFDDGGERTESGGGQNMQKHYYTVIFEFAVQARLQEDSLSAIIQLSDNIKHVLEAAQNRQMDGHVWAITIQPYAAVDAQRFLYRGRTVRGEFLTLEDTYFTY